MGSAWQRGGGDRLQVSLRNLEHIPFDEIAARMGQSAGAARVLWKRAMDRLSLLLGNQT
jgi:DNA-directed RNA polymerase specialized sigma24 family protein